MKRLAAPPATWGGLCLVLMLSASIVAASSRTSQAASPVNVASTPLNIGLPTTLAPARPTVSPAHIPSPVPTGSTSPTASPALGPTPLPTQSLATPAAFVYVFPIQPRTLASFRQGHHDYQASDILAPVGSSFVAVTSGVVDFVSFQDRWDPNADDPFTRGGLSIALIGDDGVRYYGSHLSAIAPSVAPGARVKAGQLLGYVGNSGDARFVASHLHFGISHPTYPEDWAVRRGEIDPYPYLKAWIAGDMLTPRPGE